MKKYYKRQIKIPKNKSFFLFGSRGVGKITWLRANFKEAIFISLLKAEIYNKLLANPGRLEDFIPNNFNNWVIVDEVQRVPELLNEIHYLIEEKKYKFILAGSSARRLKKEGVNLLAGRALTYYMYPLISSELENDFNLKESLQYGNLPAIFSEEDKKKYLESYVATYLHQEVLQEGLTRNLSAFGRFLEVASFSQGSILNVSEVARECELNRKVVENYFSILEDLLMSYSLPSFAKRAKRKNIKHNKFYYFDVGIYKTIRPKGPLDLTEEIDGASLETLILQELKALNDYENLGYKIYYWRTVGGFEVDFILYGERRIIALEVKRKTSISNKDLKGLKLFLKDYPESRAILLYGGREELYKNNIKILPINKFFKDILSLIKEK